MGWTCEYKNKTEQVKALLNGWTFEAGTVEVIAHKNVGAGAPEAMTDAGHLWVLYRQTQADGTVSEFITLFMFQRCERYVQYKDVSPTAGPHQRDVPREWLDRPLLQGDLENQYAQDWVKNCRAYWDEQGTAPKPTQIKTGQTYRMRGGPSQDWAHGGVKEVEYMICIDSRRCLFEPLYRCPGSHLTYTADGRLWVEGYRPSYRAIRFSKARDARNRLELVDIRTLTDEQKEAQGVAV